MIKLTVQVKASTDADWHNTLRRPMTSWIRNLAAEERVAGGELQKVSYIRPIAVVRVERTGKEATGRNGCTFMPQDVRDYWCRILGVSAKARCGEVIGGVTSCERHRPTGTVRAGALGNHQGSTDGRLRNCPFAYVLVMRDNTQAQRALRHSWLDE